RADWRSQACLEGGHALEVEVGGSIEGPVLFHRLVGIEIDHIRNLLSVVWDVGLVVVLLECGWIFGLVVKNGHLDHRVTSWCRPVRAPTDRSDHVTSPTISQCHTLCVIVDSYRFLPRSFRPFYEGRGPFPGEESPVWAPFEKRLSASRIALLTSAGVYMKESQRTFDLEREDAKPGWGDPTWRVIPATARPEDVAFAHLHINPEDMVADPEIDLQLRGLAELVDEGVVGGSVADHVAVMGYQDRGLEDWRHTTAPEIVAHLREQGAD